MQIRAAVYCGVSRCRGTALRRRFTGEVVVLSEYLGRDLVALWGYDDIR